MAASERGRDDGCVRSALFQVTKVAIALDEGDVVGTGLIHGASGEYGPLLAVNASLDQFRQPRNGDLHVSAPLSSEKGAIPPRRGPEESDAILTSGPKENNANPSRDRSGRGQNNRSLAVVAGITNRCRR
jgi:hypothetical protein